jgi:hypothetical protein
MKNEYSVDLDGKVVKFSNVDVINVIDTGMVYPTLKSIKEKELKECSIIYNYTCDTHICKFDACLTQIRESSELKSRGLRDTTLIVAQSLANNQELFAVKEAEDFCSRLQERVNS